MPLDPRPKTITTEVVMAVEGLQSGRLSRREFITRATILGLSVPVIGGVLAACAQAAATAAPSVAPSVASSAVASTAPSAVASATAVDPWSIVYPQGIDTLKGFVGPNGVTDAAVCPNDYYTVNPNGSWDWKFADFKAAAPHKMAFAHFSAKWDLMVELAARAKIYAERMGVTVDIFDNNFDADQAIKNADLIVQGKYDFAYFAQVFPDANKAIYRKLKAAGIESAYLAVEATGEPEARFVDQGNNRMFSDLGAWLGNYAKDNWSGQVDLVILAAQPRAGNYVAEREVGLIKGLKSVLPDLPDSAFVTIDSQGLLDESQKKTADVLTAHPNAKYILGSGTNDDAGVGIVRALESAGRDANACVCGQAGQASAYAELTKGTSAFRVSAMIEPGAWMWAFPIGAVIIEQGLEKSAANNLIPYSLLTKDTIADFPPPLVYSKA